MCAVEIFGALSNLNQSKIKCSLRPPLDFDADKIYISFNHSFFHLLTSFMFVHNRIEDLVAKERGREE